MSQENTTPDIIDLSHEDPLKNLGPIYNIDMQEYTDIPGKPYQHLYDRCDKLDKTLSLHELTIVMGAYPEKVKRFFEELKKIDPHEDPTKDIEPVYNIDMQEFLEPSWIPAKGVNIHPTVLLGPNVSVGDGTYIGPYCIIGYPAEHRSYWDKPCGKVYIGKNCVITGHVTIDAGTEEVTTIGDNVWMLKHSHVGHDAYVYNDVTISCGAKIGGHAKIGFRSNIGLNACVHQWVEVPEGCMVGMNSTITKKTPLFPNRKFAGSPAKDIGPNFKNAPPVKPLYKMD